MLSFLYSTYSMSCYKIKLIRNLQERCNEGTYFNLFIIRRLRYFQCMIIHEYFWDTCEGHLFVSNLRNWKLRYHNVSYLFSEVAFFRYLNLCLLAYTFIEVVRIFDIHKHQQHVPFKANWYCRYNIKDKTRKTVKKIAK